MNNYKLLSENKEILTLECKITGLVLKLNPEKKEITLVKNTINPHHIKSLQFLIIELGWFDV